MAYLRSIAVFILAAVLLLLAGGVHAAGDEGDLAGKVVTLPAGEIIDRDYFAAGEVVEVSGTVNGDVYVAGGRVLVDGRINGDLIAAGGRVRVSGDISQDARIAGGSIGISGKIGRNLAVVGGNIDLADSASVGGGMAGVGSSMSMAGPVGGNVKIAVGSLTVSDEIGGDLEAAVGQLRLTSMAAVGGGLTYWSDSEASIDERARIAGGLRHEKPFKGLEPSREKVFGVITGFALALKVVSFVSTLIVGLLFMRLFPNFNAAAVSKLSGGPWASLGIGFVFLIVVPVIALVLLATLAGIHLAFIVVALYLVSLYISRIFVILWAGTAVFRRLGREAPGGWSFLAGLVIYFVLTFVPVLGGVLAFLVLLFGLGAAVLAERDLYRAAREKAII